MVSTDDCQGVSRLFPPNERFQPQLLVPDGLQFASANSPQVIPEYHLTPEVEPSMLVSKSGPSEVADRWWTCSLEELCRLCSEVSIDRPLYMANVQSIEPKERIKKVTESATTLEELDLPTTEPTNQKRHAEFERARRENHKSALQEQYQRSNNTALKEAGWDLKSDKAPTKDRIMAAMNIQDEMHKRMNTLIQERLARTDRTIEQQSRVIEEQNRAIKEHDRIIEEKDRIIREKSKANERLKWIVAGLPDGSQMLKNIFEPGPGSLVAHYVDDLSTTVFPQKFLPSLVSTKTGSVETGSW